MEQDLWDSGVYSLCFCRDAAWISLQGDTGSQGEIGPPGLKGQKGETVRTHYAFEQFWLYRSQN